MAIFNIYMVNNNSEKNVSRIKILYLYFLKKTVIKKMYQLIKLLKTTTPMEAFPPPLPKC